MAIKTRGGELSSQPKKQSTEPGRRFILLLIFVVCVGACVWGVVAQLQNAKAYDLYTKGMAAKQAGRPKEAAEMFNEAAKAMQFALDARKKQNSDLDAEVANDITNLGLCLSELGKTDEALEKFKESEALFERLKAQSHIDYIRVLSIHSDVLLSQQRAVEAEQFCRKALDTLSATQSKDRVSYLYTYQRLRNCLMKQGKADAAREADAMATRYQNGTAGAIGQQ